MLKKNLNQIIIGLFYVLSFATLFLYENVLVPSSEDALKLQQGLFSAFLGGIVGLLIIQVLIFLGYKLFSKVDKAKRTGLRRLASEKIVTFLGILIIIKLLLNFGIDNLHLPELLGTVILLVIIGGVFFKVYRKQHDEADFNQAIFYFELVLVLIFGH